MQRGGGAGEGAKRVLARLRALRKQRARREEHGTCLVMGNEQLIKELCLGGARGAKEAGERALQAPLSLLGHHSRQRELEVLGRLTSAKKVYMLNERELQSVTGLVTVDANESVIAEVKIPAERKLPRNAMSSDQQREPTLASNVVVLDRVQDPGNVGSIIRCALAFGWRHIVFGRGSADPFGSKVLRSSRGGLLMCTEEAGATHHCLSYEYCDELGSLVSAAEAAGSAVLVAHTEGVALADYIASREASMRSGTMLVFSSESSGVSEELKRLRSVTHLHIPTSAVSESLNVAAAAAILLHQLGT